MAIACGKKARKAFGGKSRSQLRKANHLTKRVDKKFNNSVLTPEKFHKIKSQASKVGIELHQDIN